MSIYINKNNQQSGPFEETKVLEMLRSEQLSPNDLAIRHGEKEWQKLDAMFPNIEAAALPIAISPPANINPTQAKTGGGCFSTIFIMLGIILLVGGILTAVVSSGIDTSSCVRADEYEVKIKQLASELELVKGTPKETLLKPRIEVALAGIENWSKRCNEDRTYQSKLLFGGLIAAIAGMIMTIISFMTGRK